MVAAISYCIQYSKHLKFDSDGYHCLSISVKVLFIKAKDSKIVQGNKLVVDDEGKGGLKHTRPSGSNLLFIFFCGIKHTFG
jgi:hypothetical protein